jgi:hypothetical protein
VAKKTRSTFKKRQKEMARQQKRRDKLARRLERSKSRQEPPADRPGGEDPDIAGIIPGPQPPREDER